MIAEMLDLYQGGFDQTAQAWQLNAEETKKVLEGTSQAIIDSDKYVSQTKGNAKRQAAAMVPKLATGCVVATAAQKRNASGSAADSAAIGYMKTAQSQGTGAYGVVPDNSAPLASANQLCARTGGGSGGWSFIPNHGGMEKTLKCP